MAGRRPLLLASAWAAALLCNYWVLEGLLADRTNFDGSWITDLSTRWRSGGSSTLLSTGTSRKPSTLA